MQPDRGSVGHLRAPPDRTSAALPPAVGRGLGVGLSFGGPQPRSATVGGTCWCIGNQGSVARIWNIPVYTGQSEAVLRTEVPGAASLQPRVRQRFALRPKDPENCVLSSCPSSCHLRVSKVICGPFPAVF